MRLVEDSCYQVNEDGELHGHCLTFTDRRLTKYAYYKDGKCIIGVLVSEDDEADVAHVFDTGVADFLFKGTLSLYLVNGEIHGPQYRFDKHGNQVDYAEFNHGEIVPESVYSVVRRDNREFVTERGKLVVIRSYLNNELVNENFVATGEQRDYNPKRGLVTKYFQVDGYVHGVKTVHCFGELIKSTTYHYNVKHGLTTTIDKIKNYRYGKLDGDVLCFDINGRLETRFTYHSGKKLVETSYHPTHITHYPYEYGLRHGTAVTHYLDGSVTTQDWYRGQPV